MVTLTQLMRPAYHKARRLLKRGYAHILFTRYKALNSRAKTTVLGDAPVLVSLTSYGPRVDNLYATIESIGSGIVRPRKIVLWLDDSDRFENLPAEIRRLQARGLDVRLTRNLGPHTKYYPALSELEGSAMSLVTCDDDILYPRHWLADLIDASKQNPATVCCHRAFVVGLRGGQISPYSTWPNCRTTEPSVTNFATGVSGVFYPPAMLDALRERGLVFIDKTLKADDVWLHWVALRNQIPIHQVNSQPRHFPTIPGSQATGLVHSNVGAAANDRWIAQVYDRDDYVALDRAGAPHV